MSKNIDKLVLYRLDDDGLIKDIIKGNDIYKSISKLISWNMTYHLSGNIWQNYIVYKLIMSENPYSLAYERKDIDKSSLRNVAAYDMNIIYNLYHANIDSISKQIDSKIVDAINDFYDNGDKKSNLILSSFIKSLDSCTTSDEMLDILERYYIEHGVGIYGLYKSFYIKEMKKNYDIRPAYRSDDIKIDDIIGYEVQKAQLLRNTISFIKGKPANNVLLYGDSGAGKSTSIRALIDTYAKDGLRIISLDKEQMQYLSDIMTRIGDRNYKFIILLDDLSFEDGEIAYKYLKKIIEGNGCDKPSNILIYATSNRRNLIKETWNDRADMTHEDDIHHSDTIEEKLSLAHRFGIAIHYPSPTRVQYHDIVKILADKYDIHMEEIELLRQSDAWEIRHGGLSGRTATQFIQYLRGEEL